MKRNMSNAEYIGVLRLIEEEYLKSTEREGHFHSAHEGYAILLEEVDELWDEVRKKESVQSKENMKKECIQIAAMAIAFINDICFEVNTNND